MSLLGFPLMRYIDINDSEDVIRACVMTDPEVPVDLVLHTPGGLVLAATQIARAIRERKGKVTVFVPHYAMSGGTLIALAADELSATRALPADPAGRRARPPLPRSRRSPSALAITAARDSRGRRG